MSRSILTSPVATTTISNVASKKKYQSPAKKAKDALQSSAERRKRKHDDGEADKENQPIQGKKGKSPAPSKTPTSKPSSTSKTSKSRGKKQQDTYEFVIEQEDDEEDEEARTTPVKRRKTKQDNATPGGPTPSRRKSTTSKPTTSSTSTPQKSHHHHIPVTPPIRIPITPTSSRTSNVRRQPHDDIDRVAGVGQKLRVVTPQEPIPVHEHGTIKSSKKSTVATSTKKSTSTSQTKQSQHEEEEEEEEEEDIGLESFTFSMDDDVGTTTRKYGRQQRISSSAQEEEEEEERANSPSSSDQEHLWEHPIVEKRTPKKGMKKREKTQQENEALESATAKGRSDIESARAFYDALDEMSMDEIAEITTLSETESNEGSGVKLKI